MLGLNDPPIERVAVPVVPTPRADLTRALRLRTPTVRGTQVLVAVNVAVFARMSITAGSAMWFTPAHLIAWGAEFGPRTTNGEWWRLLTSTFVHAGLPHIVFNMLALITVGPAVERLVGTRAFLCFYVACGLAGSAASLWAHPFVTSVGASGSIMGIYGMLLALMINRRQPAEVHRSEGAVTLAIPRSLLQFHLHSVVGCIVSTLALGWLAPTVNNAAHVGGLAAGCLIGWVAGTKIEWSMPRPRQFAAALASSVAFCGVTLAISGRVYDIRQAVIGVFEVESRYGIEYSRAVMSKADASTLSVLIEKEIRPAFETSRISVAAIGRIPAQHQPILEDLRRYVALREDAWDLRARSLREKRPELEKKSTAIDETADVVMRRLLRARVQ